MAKKRKYHKSSIRSHSPVKKTTKGKKRSHGKKYHLSETSLPIIGKVSFKPTTHGAIGGGISALSSMFLPAKVFGIPVRLLVAFGGSVLASKMKQPFIAAGLAGAGTVMLAEDFGMLKEGFQQRKYVDPSLLKEGTVTMYDPKTKQYYSLSEAECKTLQDQFLLSESNPYGMGTFLGDASLLSEMEE